MKLASCADLMQFSADFSGCRSAANGLIQVATGVSTFVWDSKARDVVAVLQTFYNYIDYNNIEDKRVALLAFTMDEEVYAWNKDNKQWIEVQTPHDVQRPEFTFENWRKAWQVAEEITPPV